MAGLGKRILCVFMVSALPALVIAIAMEQILCIFTVSARIGLVIGRPREANFMRIYGKCAPCASYCNSYGADFIHIYGKCAHWASNWQPLGSRFYAYLR